jgi:hypothetical protein
MAGLVPIRRSKEELDRANEFLLNAHRAYLASWIAQQRAIEERPSEDVAKNQPQSEVGPRR